MSVTLEYTAGIDDQILDAKFAEFAITKSKLLVAELIGELNVNSELWGYIMDDVIVTKELLSQMLLNWFRRVLKHQLLMSYGHIYYILVYKLQK